MLYMVYVYINGIQDERFRVKIRRYQQLEGYIAVYKYLFVVILYIIYCSNFNVIWIVSTLTKTRYSLVQIQVLAVFIIRDITRYFQSFHHPHQNLFIGSYCHEPTAFLAV